MHISWTTNSYPFDLLDKVAKGVTVRGPAYVHILSVCPTGWRCAPDLSIRIGRLAVETGVFPLYEIENGKYKVNVSPANLKPVQDYFKGQGRFGHLSEETIKEIQERVTREYSELLQKAGKI
jgi:pyruvate ferredoxin oxidoreductase beta subunit